MSSSGSLCRHPPKLASNAALDPDDHETYRYSSSSFLLLLRVALFKKSLRLYPGEIWRDCFSSEYIMYLISTCGVGYSIWHHTFKMAVITLFYAEKCCHVVSAHTQCLPGAYLALYARCLLALLWLQFLIHSTLVHVHVYLAFSSPKSLVTRFSVLKIVPC